MSSATPVLATPAVEFDEPPRTHPRGHAPADATHFIAQTLKTAGIDVPCSLYNEALSLAREGHLGQAQQRLQMLLCLDPDDADALLLTAKVTAAQGRPGEAIGRLDAAVAAGTVPPAGFRDFLEAAVRADRAREEELRAKGAAREKSEINALRNETRTLRSDLVRVETEAAESRERERMWKFAAIAASAVGSLVILALVFSGAPRTAAEPAVAPLTTEAAPVVAPAAAAAPAAVPAAPAPAAVTEAPAPAAPVAAEAARTHVVASGDTLYKLANRYYGDSEEWERIRDANKSALKGGIDLKLGQKLTIP